jgi:hypothetical protein
MLRNQLVRIREVERLLERVLTQGGPGLDQSGILNATAALRSAADDSQVMLKADPASDATLQTDLPELSSREFDVYLAAELVSPAELLSLKASELVVLRAAIRSAIVASPEIRDVLRRRAEEVIAAIKGRKS